VGASKAIKNKTLVEPSFTLQAHIIENCPGLVMWDLWWTKWRWGSFSPSISVSSANIHSTNFSTINIIYHLGLVQ
jgi:hypothetical protein